MTALLVVGLLGQSGAAAVALWAYFRGRLGVEMVAGWVLSVVAVVLLRPLSHLLPPAVFVVMCLLAVGCALTALGVTFRWSRT